MNKTTSSDTVRNIEFILGCVLYIFLVIVISSLVISGLVTLFGTAGMYMGYALTIVSLCGGLYMDLLNFSMKAVHNVFEAGRSVWKWVMTPSVKTTAQPA